MAVMNGEVRIVREDELEIVNCPECGSDNVLTAKADCKECEMLRTHLLRINPELSELVKLT